jgi:hypothetical protein
MQEYIVDVKRKTLADDTELWTAVANGVTYTAASEAALRESVRLALLSDASSVLRVPEASLTTKLTRTWRVRVAETSDVADEPVWNLFD